MVSIVHSVFYFNELKICHTIKYREPGPPAPFVLSSLLLFFSSLLTYTSSPSYSPEQCFYSFTHYSSLNLHIIISTLSSPLRPYPYTQLFLLRPVIPVFSQSQYGLHRSRTFDRAAKSAKDLASDPQPEIGSSCYWIGRQYETLDETAG